MTERGNLIKIASSWASLVNSRTIAPGQDDAHVEVNRHFFLSCLRPHLAEIQVDEEWYLTRYLDVAEAIREGRIRSAKDHYVRFGFVENRMPYQIVVDEEWYAAQYPDVKVAIEAGHFASAQSHFDVTGFLEGRSPYQDFVFAQVDDD
jgi:hypothetical protein